MIKLFVNSSPRKFETTLFPDGTSQVWKIEDGPTPHDDVHILWMFENEAELFHVCQLTELLQVSYQSIPTLVCPYLPYGRQDKSTTNESTFALNTLVNMLTYVGIQKIETYDAHSSIHNDFIKSCSPQDFHNNVFNHDVVCYPDVGASKRYKYSFNIDTTQQVCFEKERDQQTGEITGLKLLGHYNPSSKSALIIDDICDGGATFIRVAKELKQLGFTKIDLAVSHGIFSKGKQVLHDAGIDNIYTTNSLLKNPEGYKVIGDDYLQR